MAVTIRGEFVDSGFPMREFTGVLENVYEDQKTYGDRTATNNMFVFGDLKDVVTTGTPYTQDTYTLQVGNSTQKTSKWAILAKSLAKNLADDQDVQDLVGKRLHMKVTGGHMLRGKQDDGTWKTVDTDCWECVGVEGAGSSGNGSLSPEAAKNLAIDLLDGKKYGEFYAAALGNRGIQGDKKLLGEIISKQFTDELVKSGAFVLDGDTYRRV